MRHQDDALRAIAAVEQGTAVDLDRATALDAARLSIRYHLARADSVMRMTSGVRDATQCRLRLDLYPSARSIQQPCLHVRARACTDTTFMRRAGDATHLFRQFRRLIPFLDRKPEQYLSNRFLREFNMRAAVILAIVLPFSTAFATETGRPTGENCSLTAPPDAAGEETDHGSTLRVYPRARDIGGKYTGCQSRWAQDKDRWNLVGVVAIAAGEPFQLWSPEVSVVTCRYDKGQLVAGDTRTCPDSHLLILKSRAPGCLEKIRRTISQGGNATPHIAGCEPE
jgi:hypothetical protein